MGDYMKLEDELDRVLGGMKVRLFELANLKDQQAAKINELKQQTQAAEADYIAMLGGLQELQRAVALFDMEPEPEPDNG